MKKPVFLFLTIAGAILFLVHCQQEQVIKGSVAHIQQITAAIDDEAILNADANQGDWLSYGRNYKEDRYSELSQITKENVNEVGLAWATEIGTKKGLQATPIVVDGVMFFSGPFNQVWAYDVRTGEEIWYLDPDFNHDKNLDLCCGFSNRGLAVYKGNLYMGMLDLSLIHI